VKANGAPVGIDDVGVANGVVLGGDVGNLEDFSIPCV
jgi:hypothetical protein